MITITGRTAPQLFVESLYKMRVYALEENSRNGPVRTILSPVVLRLMEPDHRVITDPVRDANPFFHVMEFIWMMAGSNKIEWIAQFNKNMMKYSDDGKTQHAAYGFRWRSHFNFDQVETLVRLLRENPLDRRLVINMWDPWDDLGTNSVDVPCNTQLLFRVVDGELQMSVINRSNDLIWGALGANVCHMTMLQELIAQAAGLSLGEYFVFTQNLHIYESVPNFDYYMKDPPHARNVYSSRAAIRTVPLLHQGETLRDFVDDCLNVVGAQGYTFRTQWMKTVGASMYNIWQLRKIGQPYDTKQILADDWRIACEEWIQRRRNTTVDNQRSYPVPGVAGGIPVQEVVAFSLGESRIVAPVDNPQCDMGAAPTESGTDSSVSQEPL